MPHTIAHLNFLSNQLQDLIDHLHAPFLLTAEDTDEDDVCQLCSGTGEVATDEDDGEGHIMRGVGTKKCICQYDA